MFGSASIPATINSEYGILECTSPMSTTVLFPTIPMQLWYDGHITQSPFAQFIYFNPALYSTHSISVQQASMDNVNESIFYITSIIKCVL